MPRMKEAAERDHDDQLVPSRWIRAPLPAEFKATVNFIIKAGNHEWNVHKEPITSKSKFFELMTNSVFKEAAEQTVNLPEDDPELVARMIIWCYFGMYPLIPNQQVVLGAETVTQALQKSWTGEENDFVSPVDYPIDAVLHLKMYVLAEKFDMEKLQKYARYRCKVALGYEPVGFVKCAEMLEEMPEHVAVEVKAWLTNLRRAGRR